MTIWDCSGRPLCLYLRRMCQCPTVIPELVPLLFPCWSLPLMTEPLSEVSASDLGFYEPLWIVGSRRLLERDSSSW